MTVASLSGDYYDNACINAGCLATDSTREPESTLPPSLVADYEAGIVREIQKESFTTGGRTVHTLSASATEPNMKRLRTYLNTQPLKLIYLHKCFNSTITYSVQLCVG